MHKLRINRLAQGDLEKIQERGLAEFGLAVTRAHMEGIDRIFAQLQTYPLLGSSRPEYGRVVRGCSYPPYKILYRYEGEVIFILRILHASQGYRKIDDTVQ
ncbi:MAG: type II toxin-antitoxin system RelE/ParE family toxin [Novosphingobium sp.]